MTTTAETVIDIVFREFKAAMDALNASIAQSDRIRAVIDNEEYDEKENKAGYAKCQFVAQPTRSPAIGNNILDNRATVMVSLFTPINCGVADAMKIAHQIRDHFTGMKFYKATEGGKTKITFAPGTATQRGQEGIFNQVLIDVPCRYMEYRNSVTQP